MINISRFFDNYGTEPVLLGCFIAIIVSIMCVFSGCSHYCDRSVENQEFPPESTSHFTTRCPHKSLRCQGIQKVYRCRGIQNLWTLGQERRKSKPCCVVWKCGEKGTEISREVILHSLFRRCSLPFLSDSRILLLWKPLWCCTMLPKQRYTITMATNHCIFMLYVLRLYLYPRLIDSLSYWQSFLV